MENERKNAHFRTKPNGSQCNLLFTFTFENITEKVDAVRQIKDTVSSLVVHTKNKIKKILQDNKKEVETVTVSITADGNSVDNFSCKDLLEHGSNVILNVNNTDYDVVLNSPYINFGLLPKILYVGDDIRPINLKLINAVECLCKYMWFISKDKKNWKKVCDEASYKPSIEDIGYYLKLIIIPKNKKTEGEEYEIISEEQIKTLPCLNDFPFESRHKFTTNKLSGKCFRIVTYNILSEIYTKDGFSYCPEEFLSIHYRKHLLVKEILGYNADIICLQEVDLKILKPFFNKMLKSHGLIGIYNKKGNRMPEGLATIFLEDRFTQKKVKHYVLATIIKSQAFRDIWIAVSADPEILNHFMKQATSCQLTLLEENETKKLIIIVNTHLFYHPLYSYIRLIQMGMITRIAKQFSKEVSKKYKRPPIILFCGDFNSQPHSGVYKFLKKGHLSENHPEWTIQDKSIKNLKLDHPFRLKSAYGTQEITNYVADFHGCLDYVFYDTTQLKIIQTVPLPSKSVLQENVALPSQVFPSDHLALIVDFLLIR